MIELYKLN